MNLQSIIITDLMGVLILGVLVMSSYLVIQRRQLSDRIFTAMCSLTALSCIADMLSFMVDGQEYKGASLSAWFFDSFTYSTNIIVSIMWALYVDLRLYRSRKHMKKTLELLCLPAVIGLIGVVINLRWHFVFDIDSENVYHRMPASSFYFFVTYFYLISSIFIRRRHRKKYGKTGFVPVWLFLTPIIFCTTAQFLVYGISLAWCSVAIGLVSVHMGLQNELSYLDPLTRLYNRNYLTHVMDILDYSHMSIRGIMLDMDHFKCINDNYGHNEGDAALIEAAKIITSSLTENAIPIRYAGDEFLIIIPSGTESDISSIIESIRKDEKEFNENKRKPYKLLFSLGESYMKAGGDKEQFLKEMDDNMYNNKRARHIAEAAT